jgi:hypothetical protein
MESTPAATCSRASPASDFFGLFSGVSLKFNALHAFQVFARSRASVASAPYSSVILSSRDRRTAGHFAFCGARSHYSFSSGQLGSSHNVVHIRVFCCSGIGLRGPPHHFVASLRQKEVLMPRLNVSNSNSAPLLCAACHPFCRLSALRCAAEAFAAPTAAA